MQLDWTTFLLEIVNFLVLVWLLKRFFYQPVLKVIGARQAAIDDTVAKARAKELAASALAEKYDARLKDWEKEREQARSALREEVGKERERLLAKLNSDLDEERTRQHAVDDKTQREWTLRAETTAVARAGSFASRLLQRLAGPELEGKLIDVAIEDLAALSPARLAELRATLRDARGTVAVVTAYPLADERRDALKTAIRPLRESESKYVFTTDPALLAGMRVTVGPWTLRANLADELKAFVNADRNAA
jgi:F-type H+-transporting ATPase subunit b